MILEELINVTVCFDTVTVFVNMNGINQWISGVHLQKHVLLSYTPVIKPGPHHLHVFVPESVFNGSGGNLSSSAEDGLPQQNAQGRGGHDLVTIAYVRQ